MLDSLRADDADKGHHAMTSMTFMDVTKGLDNLGRYPDKLGQVQTTYEFFNN